MSRRACLLVLALATGCAGDRERREPADTTLRSGDRVTIYDAGVEAYRAKDFARARALWQRAAELGEPTAASNLGYLLYYGIGGPPDSVAAEGWWRQAMDSGEAEAHRHVAQAIIDGNQRLGTLDDAYAHAVAAKILAQQPNQLDASGIARDAEALITLLSGRLPVWRQRAARQVGEQWGRAVRRR